MSRFVRSTALAGLLGALVFGVVALVATDETVAAKGGGGGGGGGGSQCPRQGIACFDLYDPVICSNGQTYGNACYAYVDCATGCVSTGGGPVVAQ